MVLGCDHVAMRLGDPLDFCWFFVLVVLGRVPQMRVESRRPIEI